MRRLAAGLAIIAVANLVTHLWRLPDRVPTHIDITGAPDAWGSPATAITGVALISVLAAALAWMVGKRYPLNLPFTVHEGNAARVRCISDQMLAQIAFSMGLLAVSLSYTSFTLWNTNAVTLAALAVMFGALAVGTARLLSRRSR